MSEKEQRVPEMAAIRMPTEHMDFIRRNQKIAEKAGKIMLMLTDMQKSVKAIGNC